MTVIIVLLGILVSGFCDVGTARDFATYFFSVFSIFPFQFAGVKMTLSSPCSIPLNPFKVIILCFLA